MPSSPGRRCRPAPLARPKRSSSGCARGVGGARQEGRDLRVRFRPSAPSRWRRAGGHPARARVHSASSICACCATSAAMSSARRCHLMSGWRRMMPVRRTRRVEQDRVEAPLAGPEARAHRVGGEQLDVVGASQLQARAASRAPGAGGARRRPARAASRCASSARGELRGSCRRARRRHRARARPARRRSASTASCAAPSCTADRARAPARQRLRRHAVVPGAARAPDSSGASRVDAGAAAAAPGSRRARPARRLTRSHSGAGDIVRAPGSHRRHRASRAPAPPPASPDAKCAPRDRSDCRQGLAGGATQQRVDQADHARCGRGRAPPRRWRRPRHARTTSTHRAAPGRPAAGNARCRRARAAAAPATATSTKS